MMKRASSMVCWVGGALLLPAGAIAPALAEGTASTSLDLGQLSEMIAELRSLNGKADRLADIHADLRVLQEKLEKLIHSGWEYLFIARNRFVDREEQTESLGREGWELVAVTEEEGFIFKRRIQAAQ